MSRCPDATADSSPGRGKPQPAEQGGGFTTRYKARMEFGGWEENRRSNLDWLAKAGDLTDVTILVDTATFPVHRVVLAAHSDCFYRMFTCGMTESRNEDIKIQGIEPEVFQQVGQLWVYIFEIWLQVLNYIYTGRVETNEAEVVKGIFLAANMLQMSDLEQLTVRDEE